MFVSEADEISQNSRSFSPPIQRFRKLHRGKGLAELKCQLNFCKISFFRWYRAKPSKADRDFFSSAKLNWHSPTKFYFKLRKERKKKKPKVNRIKLSCFNPLHTFQLWNPFETHQEAQRYQFIYLMSKHFSSTILKLAQPKSTSLPDSAC